MRNRWVMVCALLVTCVFIGCAAGVERTRYTAPADKMVVLDAAKVTPGPNCGQSFRPKLQIVSDEVSGNDEARHVIFLVQNLSGESRVVIGTKPTSDNPAGWKDITLDASNTVQETPRVGRGQVKHQSKWDYQIVFKLDGRPPCRIDPGVCIRTQSGGCEGYY